MNFSPGEINIICSDIQRSLHFYTEIFGFEILGEEDGCYHLRCGGYLFLLLPIARQRVETAPYGSVPTFSADLLTADLEAAFQYLSSHNVAVERPWLPGARSFVIRDPDGLVWEIIGQETGAHK